MSDSTFNQFLSRGTSAQRLAYTPNPPTPVSGPLPGYLWFETDPPFNLYAWSGSVWLLIAAAIPGGIGAFMTAEQTDVQDWSVPR